MFFLIGKNGFNNFIFIAILFVVSNEFKLYRMTSNDYDVLNLDTLNTNPYCVHGPTVLFSNKLKKFFSCSACRDHKLCNFYANYDGKSFSEDKLNKWKNIYLEFNANKSDFQEEYF